MATCSASSKRSQETCSELLELGFVDVVDLKLRANAGRAAAEAASARRRAIIHSMCAAGTRASAPE